MKTIASHEDPEPVVARSRLWLICGGSSGLSGLHSICRPEPPEALPES